VISSCSRGQGFSAKGGEQQSPGAVGAEEGMGLNWGWENYVYFSLYLLRFLVAVYTFWLMWSKRSCTPARYNSIDFLVKGITLVVLVEATLFMVTTCLYDFVTTPALPANLDTLQNGLQNFTLPAYVVAVSLAGTTGGGGGGGYGPPLVVRLPLAGESKLGIPLHD
jgi:hypothetical protein